LELERPVVELEEPVPAQSLEERARALFKDLPPTPADSEEETAGAEDAVPARLETPAPARPSAGDATRAPFIPPRIQRPPAAQRGGPKPVFSSSAPARPAADRGAAAPPPRTFGP